MAINLKRKKKKLVVVGLGECGLATFAYQKQNGSYKTTGFSFDEERVGALNSRKAKYEEEALRGAIQKSHVFFSSNPVDLVEADVFYVCLEDEVVDENNETLLALIEALKRNVKPEIAIIIRGICVVGATRKIKGFCKKELENKEVLLLCVPCFESKGKYYLSEKNPYRIVIGCESKDEETIGLKLYASLIAKGVPAYSTTYEEAEIALLASFSYYSIKSAFSYEIRKEGKKHGCDIDMLAQIIGADPRIGRSFLTQKTIYRGNDELLASIIGLPLLKQVKDDRNNEAMDVMGLLKDSLGNLAEKKIALVGLGNDGLLEESLAISLFPLLSKECHVECFDFSLSNEEAFQKKFPEAIINSDFFITIKDADAIVISAPAFALSSLQEKDILPLAKGRTIIDCGGSLDRRKFKFFDILSPGKKPQLKDLEN